jgi:hypothetical protein
LRRARRASFFPRPSREVARTTISFFSAMIALQKDFAIRCQRSAVSKQEPETDPFRLRIFKLFTES